MLLKKLLYCDMGLIKVWNIHDNNSDSLIEMKMVTKCSMFILEVY